jgi:geranylgeranyl pyrophosphate synthase
MTPTTPHTDFESVARICRPAIESRLERFFAERADAGIRWNAEMSRYHFATGGKRLRALIPCWVYAVSGKPPQDAIPLGCALELIHNATLVHDDLQDRDTVRRGQPTVWHRYSEAQAINCGDALFQLAFEMLFEMDLTAERFRRVTRRLVTATLLVIEGQAQEFLMKDEAAPGLNRYLEVVRGKTAALIAAAVVAAMEALGLDASACGRAEAVALECGTLFQIQDDLLDIYGDKRRDQKAADIAEGKISALIAVLNENAQEAEQEKVAGILRKTREQTSLENIEETLALFEKYAIREKVLQRIASLRRTVEDPSALGDQPAIHRMLVEMNQRFLEPIGHLIRG